MISRFDQLVRTIANVLKTGDLITVLTGAGVSAESGIPTFRGPEGYWTVGSRNYQPSEIATQAMFQRNPKEIWKWFLYRRGICEDALPNPGHLAIVKMEKLLGSRFRLVTQNVDGLHLRAGSNIDRTYQVHGNLNYMRCARECYSTIYPLPSGLSRKARGDDLSKNEWDMLVCPKCGAMTRPHVLLWDEYYDEQYYRLESSLDAASKTALLIVVGTTGSANIPNQIVATVLRRGGTVIDINPNFNVFSEAAQRSAGGLFLQGNSASILPTLADLIIDLIANGS
ncbi:Sir2 family NAD-dependent protein deacetylase [Methyloglobulus sp.]|uniref:SIR2 family NAD-dependent protein deacylase n=1 Tax=Methyloglobulus sp. TaxID=2518622 RepID=UPI0032B77E6F